MKLLEDYQQILQVLVYFLTIDHTDTNPLGSPCISGSSGW